MKAKKNPKRSDIRRGLVLSGGAALGAYQAGALKAVHEHGVEFHAIAATSIGVLHALAWNRGIIPSIEDHWRRNATDLKPFRLRRLLRLQSPFRFRASLDELIERYRDGQPQAGDPGHVPMMISLTEARTGENAAFSLSSPDLTQEERVNIIRAATIIPPLGDDPVEIRGKRYYDGGFSNNAPVSLLEGMDLDEVWVITLLPPRRKTATTVRAWRTAGGIRKRTKNPWIIGATGLLLQLFDPNEAPCAFAAEILIRPEPQGPFGPARLIKSLTFSPKNIETLLALGYRDGLRVCRDDAARAKSLMG